MLSVIITTWVPALEILVELVLLTAFTLLRTQSLLQMKADGTAASNYVVVVIFPPL